MSLTRISGACGRSLAGLDAVEDEESGPKVFLIFDGPPAMSLPITDGEVFAFLSINARIVAVGELHLEVAVAFIGNGAVPSELKLASEIPQLLPVL